MSYKLSDSVSMRMIQIFQEALLLGVDGADLLRQVRLVVDSKDETSLVLDPQYEQQVSEMHNKYLAEAETLKSKQTSQQAFVFEI